MSPAKFWIVWGPSEGKPKVRHTSAEAAHKEAARLASKFDGPFIVLESVGEHRKPTAMYIPHEKRLEF